MSGICFFIGSRDTPSEVIPFLSSAIEKVITEHHVTLFVTGGRGRFDRMAAECVQKMKERYPQIRLCLMLAYHPAEHPSVYPLPPGYDESWYPLERPVPARVAIARVNRWMIGHSSVCIACAAHPGNARRMLELAARRAARSELILIDLSSS